MSRPLLEGTVRDRVRTIPNVRFLDDHGATGLSMTPDNARVVGVFVTARGGADARVLECDLVVDASGRGSRSPEWLREFGYEPPVVEEVKVGIGYATRTYRRRPEDASGARAVIVGADPRSPRPAAMLAVEDDPSGPGAVGVPAGQIGQGPAGLGETHVGAVADGQMPEGLRDMAFPDTNGSR